MIARAPGWSWEVRGGGVTMVPPEGPTYGAIRYRERVTPMRSVQAILGAKPGDAATTIGAIHPVVTAEGEYAAVVDVRTMLGPNEVQYTLGVVYGDDWYSEVVGTALRPDQFERFSVFVRELVRDSRLGLGVRRRRFLYEPPPRWHGYVRLPTYASWFPPDHPADVSSIQIYPALPTESGIADGEHLGMLGIGPPAGAVVLRELSPMTSARTARLSGSAWEFEVRDDQGREVQRRLVMLRDERYFYTVYLDTTALPFRRAVLDALLDSIEPIPTGLRGSAPLLDHWF